MTTNGVTLLQRTMNSKKPRPTLLNDSISLLGTDNDTYDMTTTNHRIGEVNYELTNHLGNVLSVMPDKPIPHDNSGTADYWLADIRSSQDYSPFGVTLSGRNFTLTGAEKGRYGFNGKENDGELKGEGNSYDYGARMYDPRLGRWLTIDPYSSQYANFSPYAAFANSPIFFTDQNGGLLRDKEGNLVVTCKKGAKKINRSFSERVTNEDGTVTETIIKSQVIDAYVWTNKGRKVPVQILVGQTTTTTVYSAENTQLSKTESNLLQRDVINLEANCHGLTFGGDHVVIDNADVQRIISDDGWEKVTTAKDAEIVVFSKSGKIVHSSVVNGNGTYDSNAREYPTEKGITLEEAAGKKFGGMMTNISDPANVKYYNNGSDY